MSCDLPRMSWSTVFQNVSQESKTCSDITAFCTAMDKSRSAVGCSTNNDSILAQSINLNYDSIVSFFVMNQFQHFWYGIKAEIVVIEKIQLMVKKIQMMQFDMQNIFNILSYCTYLRVKSWIYFEYWYRVKCWR